MRKRIIIENILLHCHKKNIIYFGMILGLIIFNLDVE
jgi:hypothetical protein